MEIYRIAKAEFIQDLSGVGARMFGARWHLQGTGIIYTSESRALAAMEYIVHLPISIIPDDLKIAVISIPDNITPNDISISDLRGSYPAPESLALLGTNWAKSKRSLLLRVPSAIVPHEYNILINPAHSDMNLVKIETIEDFEYDSRILER